ncbi:EamA family transporter [Nostoc sp.]|uniref:EamA family transporter n=1 Tax=Nostoc sp. TaxID=1180 RepID=UPI002FF8A004
MNINEFLLLLVSVLASLAGQFFLKSGAIKLGKINLANFISHFINIIVMPEMIIGLSFYALGAVFYIYLLTRVNLSIAAPSTSIVYVFSVFVGLLFFKETMSLLQLTGLGFIIIGIILLIGKAN